MFEGSESDRISLLEALGTSEPSAYLDLEWSVYGSSANLAQKVDLVVDHPEQVREVPTRLLCLYEGFTAYYDVLVLVRSGVIEEASYLELLARQITRVLQAPGRQVRSVEEASFDAWMLLFRAPEHASKRAPWWMHTTSPPSRSPSESAYSS